MYGASWLLHWYINRLYISKGGEKNKYSVCWALKLHILYCMWLLNLPGSFQNVHEALYSLLHSSRSPDMSKRTKKTYIYAFTYSI